MKWEAVTWCYCCKRRFNGYHEAGICVTLCGSRGQSVHLAGNITTTNELYLSLEGKTTTAISAHGKTKTFLYKRVLKNMHWKNNTGCFPTLNEFFNERESQEKWRSSFTHSEALRKPTSYNERVLYTCHRRFLVVIKPVYAPSHRARVINKTINQHFNRTEVWNIYTQPLLRSNSS